MKAETPTRLLIHGVTCDCRPGCKPGGVCRWVGCCRSPIESARVLPPQEQRSSAAPPAKFTYSSEADGPDTDEGLDLR